MRAANAEEEEALALAGEGSFEGGEAVLVAVSRSAGGVDVGIVHTSEVRGMRTRRY